MADETTEEATQDKDDEIVTLNRSQIRSMESKAKAHDTLAKKVAFMEAGVDYSAGIGKLAFDSFNGDMTADAVKEFAVEYGVIEAPSEEPAPEAAAEEDAQTRANAQLRRAAAVGADVADGGEHPSDVARKVAEERMNTRPREEAIAAAAASKATAALNGDKRALVQ